MSTLDNVDDLDLEDNDFPSNEINNIIHFKEALTEEDRKLLTSELGDDIHFEGSCAYVPTKKLEDYKPSLRIYEKISHIEIFDYDYFSDDNYKDFCPPLCFFLFSPRDILNYSRVRDFQVKRSPKESNVANKSNSSATIQSEEYQPTNPLRYRGNPWEVPYGFMDTPYNWTFRTGIRACRALYLNATVIDFKSIKEPPKPMGKIVSIDEFNVIKEIDIAKWNDLYSHRSFHKVLYDISTLDGDRHSIFIAIRMKLNDNCAAVAYEV